MKLLSLNNKFFRIIILPLIIVLVVGCNHNWHSHTSDDNAVRGISALYYLDTLTLDRPFLIKIDDVMYIASKNILQNQESLTVDSTQFCLFPTFDENVANYLFWDYYDKVGDTKSKSFRAKVMQQACLSTDFLFEDFVTPDCDLSGYETFQFKYCPTMFALVLVRGGKLFDVEYFDFTEGVISVPGEGYYIAALPIFSYEVYNNIRKDIGWKPIKLLFKKTYFPLSGRHP